MALQKLNFYRATILNPLNDEQCDYYKDGLLVVAGHKIKDLLSFEKGNLKYAKKMNSKNTFHFKDSVILPGFFDMHFHWVQDDVRMMPKDSLLEWLNLYTFPAEMKFEDASYSNKKAKVFFKQLTKMGTIGGACYSSIHETALNAAMDEVVGDFVIGNVLMNMNSPKELTQSEIESLNLNQKFIKKYKTRYCFTPRFAISTSPEVMKKGAKKADQARCFKQTHLSETPQEIEFVKSIYHQLPGFKKIKNYTEIYQKVGMLGKRSLMGHGIHLSQSELSLLSKTKTSLIHCPTSNAPHKDFGLGSGLFNFKKVEKAKVRWALGSDIGGGPFLSMFDVMNSFVEQNKKKKITEATFIKALYRATLAGAQILGVNKKLGNLKKGKDASFLVVQAPQKSSKSAEAVLMQIMKIKREKYSSLVERVYYQGKLV